MAWKIPTQKEEADRKIKGSASPATEQGPVNIGRKSERAYVNAGVSSIHNSGRAELVGNDHSGVFGAHVGAQIDRDVFEGVVEKLEYGVDIRYKEVQGKSGKYQKRFNTAFLRTIMGTPTRENPGGECYGRVLTADREITAKTDFATDLFWLAFQSSLVAEPFEVRLGADGYCIKDLIAFAQYARERFPRWLTGAWSTASTRRTPARGPRT